MLAESQTMIAFAPWLALVAGPGHRADGARAEPPRRRPARQAGSAACGGGGVKWMAAGWMAECFRGGRGPGGGGPSGSGVRDAAAFVDQTKPKLVSVYCQGWMAPSSITSSNSTGRAAAALLPRTIVLPVARSFTVQTSPGPPPKNGAQPMKSSRPSMSILIVSCRRPKANVP